MWLGTWSCDWELDHVTGSLIMWLGTWSCDWELDHVTGSLIMWLGTWSCDWELDHVTIVWSPNVWKFQNEKRQHLMLAYVAEIELFIANTSSQHWEIVHEKNNILGKLRSELVVPIFQECCIEPCLRKRLIWKGNRVLKVLIVQDCLWASATWNKEVNIVYWINKKSYT